MSEVTITPRAYIKMIFHAAKYPYCAVNGILLAERNEKSKQLTVTDVIPLFHQCLHVSPMVEIALIQVCFLFLLILIKFCVSVNLTSNLLCFLIFFH